jgi:PncC family amidohydrolase
VSEECVNEMVRGCLDACHSDVALAFTGVAGPGGGSEEKPVGTVWIGWGNKSDIRTKKFLLGNHRQRNIHLAAVYGLNELRKFIGEKYGP